MSKKDNHPVKATIVDATALDINDAVRLVSERAATAFERKEGGISDLGKEFYEAALPEGMDLVTARKYQDHDSTFLAGVAHAGGAEAMARFQAEPGLQNVSINFHAGYDRGNLSFSRDGEIEGRWMKKGIGSAGSQYGKVRSHFSNLIREQLGEKKD